MDFVQPESNNARSIFPLPVLGSFTIIQISAYRRLLLPIVCSFGTFRRFGPSRCTVYTNQLFLSDFSARLAFLT